MRIFMGFVLIITGLTMVGQPWYSHVAVVSFGIVCLCVKP